MTEVKAEIQFKKFNNKFNPSQKTLVVGLGTKGNEFQISAQAKKWPLVKSLFESVFSGEEAFKNLEGFHGKLGQSFFFASTNLVEGYKNLLLIGLGESEKLTAQNFLSLGASLGQAVKSQGLSGVELALESLVPKSLKAGEDRAGRKIPGGKLELTDAYEKILSGLHLGLYEFTAYKSQDKNSKKSKKIAFNVVSTSLTDSQGKKLLLKSEILSESVYIARDLMNTPPNDLRPNDMAQTASKIGRTAGFTTTIWDEKRLKKEGMNGILTVGRGSKAPPRLIVMSHNASKKNLPTLVLVGKGVSFDTGGISIKPSPGMDAMKMDMGGAATVIGAMSGIARSKAPVRVIGIVGAAENMPDGDATRPGDVYTSYTGKTVEVLNTDAEGRLVLADCLGYAKTFNPDAVIDLATLTGAVVIALGAACQAVMGNDAKLIESFIDRSYAEGEPSWELPLFQSYVDDIKGKVADLQNIGTNRSAGSSKAGAFLGEFVDYPWLHVDIAGVMDAGAKDQGAHCVQGASGIPTRSLVEFAYHFKKKKK